MAAPGWASSSNSVVYTTGSSSYEVFINFRGEDTRNNFTGFLHKALKDTGINVFFDSEKLWTGEAIGPALLRAIEGSKISITVFSKGYAHSKWCLLELAHIVQCHRSNGQLVLPIFFDVDPSHVRNQTGSFKAAFRVHEKKFEPHIVKSWREALRVIGNLKGEVLDKTKDQAELVELVVKRALGELVSSTQLAECKYPIGIDSQVKNLLSILNIGSNDVQFVGICGLGGIGKTTIAKAVYNRFLLFFNRYSFLSDVREQARQCMGLVSLQKQLLRDIIKADIDIGDYHRGKKLIEQRLCKEKVLFVLDDVDSQDQVDALAGELTWFGQGSMVIITTRDEHILNLAKVDKDKIYWPQELDHKESLQLFSLHAFSMDQPPKDYIQLSHDVACYSGGLPLTLEVLGSYLSDISSKEEWESTLQKLKEIPHGKIQRRLKISYDNLEDDYQKAIFLDAACFFIGWKKETIISIWEACGYYPKSAIPWLVKRSLIKFEHYFGDYYLKMHDQIRDMGREIVLEESFMEQGKRSRLWSHGEILEVLEGHKGTDMIKGIILPSSLRDVNLASEDFEMMSNLRLLDINEANFKGDFSRLHSALRWFRWGNCPWDILPTNFYHRRLVHLDLSGSRLEQTWNVGPRDENKFLELKVLNLSKCYLLYKSPDFSWFPHLEQLNLGSHNLDKLDESIGQLSELKSLVINCWKMKELPKSIGDLKSLVKLDLSWMLQMEELPDCIFRLGSLEELTLSDCCSVKKFPESIGDLKSLVKLYLFWIQIEELPDSIFRLSSLKKLTLKNCGLLKKLPETIGTLKSLVELDLSGSSRIEELSDGVGLLDQLEVLYAYHCDSLVRLPDLSRLKNLRKLQFYDCEKLEAIRGLGGTESLVQFYAPGCYNLTHTPKKIHGQGILIPYRSKVYSYSLTADDGIYYNKRLILCIVFEFNSDLMNILEWKQGQLLSFNLEICVSIRQKDKTIECHHGLRIEEVEFTAHEDVIYMHHFEGFDWFGIPLEGKDAIEYLDIYESHARSYGKVKFWKLLFEDMETNHQRTNQYSNAMMVADFFDWSYVDWSYVVDNGEVPSLQPSLKSWSGDEDEGSNSIPEEKEIQSDTEEAEMIDIRTSSYVGVRGYHNVPEEAELRAIWRNAVATMRYLWICIYYFFYWRICDRKLL